MKSALERSSIIFIVGTTAVGKTKLSIQLCKALNGQVINCDSKQLYKHANIMTAKATTQQIQGIRHHMLDVLELHQNCYNRNKYFSEAIRCVEEIRGRGKIPVVIGGTNYYLETLLYDIEIREGDGGEEFELKEKEEKEKEEIKKTEQVKEKKQGEQGGRITKQQIAAMTKQQRYTHLKLVDPILAQKLHPNDSNRITRFLQRYSETGIQPSTAYKPYIHRLRFENSILFWIRNSDKKELHGLMEGRIGKMVAAGGLGEAIGVWKYAEIWGLKEGLRMGALQSIGYKEFQDVYETTKDILADPQFDSKKRDYPEIKKHVNTHIAQIREKAQQTLTKSHSSNKKIPLLQRSLEALTKNTIDYSKRQITWIKNRLFACQDNRSHFFVLQLEDKKSKKGLMERFQINVRSRALEILRDIEEKGVGTVKEDAKEFTANRHEGIGEWKKYQCEQCGVEVNGSHQWNQHLNSRKHQRVSSKKERKMRKMEEKAKKKSLEQQSDKQSDQENEAKSEQSEQPEVISDQDNEGPRKKKPKQQQKQ